MLNALENSSAGFFKNQHVQYRRSLTENDINLFGSLKNDEEKLQFVYKNPLVHASITKVGTSSDKNIEIAKQFKADGNKAFQAEAYGDAILIYSKSIFKYPQNNEENQQELSVLFANRSAAFYHIQQHHKALDDIKIALEFGYPKPLHYKVLDRKARCLLALKQHKTAVDAFRSTLTALDDAKLPLERKQKWQKDVQIMLAMLSKHCSMENGAETINEGDSVLPNLSGKQNKERPAVSDSITFKETKDEGRFAEAKKSIKAGDVIVIEKPHCAVLLQERVKTHCFHCFKKLIARYPCPKCSCVGFCSIQCQKSAMQSYHKYECAILPIMWEYGVSITCLMAVRIFTQKSLEYFLNLKPSLEKNDARGKSFPHTDYRSVYYLERNESKRSVEDFLQRTHMAVFLFNCLKSSGYFDHSETNQGSDQQLTKDQIFIGGLMLRNLQFLQFNAHEVSELEIQNNDLHRSNSLFLGGAIYPTLSLFNHSCNPAIVRYFQGTTVICRAIRTTHQGEMIAENYGPNFTQTPRTDRLATLKNQYWFDCKCIACDENWPLFEQMEESTMRFLCETNGCKNVLIVPVDTMKFMALCPSCGEHTNLLKGLKTLQDTDSMFRIAQAHMNSGENNKAVLKFIELLQMLEETLAPPFRDFHLCQQAARTCMLAFGNVIKRKTC